MWKIIIKNDLFRFVTQEKNTSMSEFQNSLSETKNKEDLQSFDWKSGILNPKIRLQIKKFLEMLDPDLYKLINTDPQPCL